MVVRIRWKSSPWQRSFFRVADHWQDMCRSRYRDALLLATPLAGLLCFASTAADATVQATMEASHCLTAQELQAIPYIPNVDPRYARLEKFFEHYRCPAPRYIEEYLRLADAHGLDYRLLPAISVRETQCGVHEKGNNRIGFHPSTITFPSVLTGIEFIADRLAKHPYYQGKTLEGKLFKYNPKPAYPREVAQIMRQIER